MAPTSVTDFYSSYHVSDTYLLRSSNWSENSEVKKSLELHITLSISCLRYLHPAALRGVMQGLLLKSTIFVAIVIINTKNTDGTNTLLPTPAPLAAPDMAVSVLETSVEASHTNDANSSNIPKLYTKFADDITRHRGSKLVGIRVNGRGCREDISLGILLEFASFVWLRLKFPALKRPYRVPLGVPALVVELNVLVRLWLPLPELAL
ncbi:hypothetical protein L6452_23977 [Arctium lappa]|uniref:Uncharacterized protein n=1 Tax=Arctium lappa TaxID=4217 RepID=A0ACB9A8L9_ARCLA|nr:hypothetical protein L6452_23977 [Arctium lappa]